MTALWSIARSGAAAGLSEALKVGASVHDLVVRQDAGVVILAYHQVGGGTESSVDLPIDVFRRQMEWIAEHLTVVGLDDAAQLLAKPSDGTSRVVLTFDDGTADYLDNAVAILAELGLPSTVYVATKFVDESQRFPWGAPPLSWQALRDAKQTGLVTIGGHTHEHLVMSQLGHEEAMNDLTRSNELIAEHTGAAPAHFAYPKGVLGSSGAASAVKKLYATAAGGRVGPNIAQQSDLYALRRSPIQTLDRQVWFRRKARGGLVFEGVARESLNHLRYRHARQ